MMMYVDEDELKDLLSRFFYLLLLQLSVVRQWYFQTTALLKNFATLSFDLLRICLIEKVVS